MDLLCDALRRFGHARLRVNGTSMLPSVWPGTLLAVQRVHASELLPGDIVLLQRDRRLFCHRLVALVERDGHRFLCTRGDFLSADDPLVPVEDLLGRVDPPRASALLSGLSPFLRAIAHIFPRLIAWWVRRRAQCVALLAPEA